MGNAKITTKEDRIFKASTSTISVGEGVGRCRFQAVSEDMLIRSSSDFRNLSFIGVCCSGIYIKRRQMFVSPRSVPLQLSVRCHYC